MISGDYQEQVFCDDDTITSTEDWVLGKSAWRKEREQAKTRRFLYSLLGLLLVGLVFYALVRKSQVEAPRNYTPVETVSISNMQLLQSNGK